MKKTYQPKFSVITPVHLWNTDRVDKFLECIRSLKEQTFKDFEWIVVDDGSTVPFNWDRIHDIGADTTLIKRAHEERVISYSAAFEKARGEWFTLLDSDDEYVPTALKKMSATINKHPKEKMFNFGCMFQNKDGGVWYRDAFKPKRLKEGHEKFGGGNIVNGTFIWHKSVYKDLGAFPEAHLKNVDCTAINYRDRDGNMIRDLYMGSPYDFSAAAQLEFPEIREYFMVDHENEPDKIVRELGNPWGQDFMLYYKYTRKYHSIPIKEYLLLVHPR